MHRALLGANPVIIAVPGVDRGGGMAALGRHGRDLQSVQIFLQCARVFVVHLVRAA